MWLAPKSRKMPGSSWMTPLPTRMAWMSTLWDLPQAQEYSIPAHWEMGRSKILAMGNSSSLYDTG